MAMDEPHHKLASDKECAPVVSIEPAGTDSQAHDVYQEAGARAWMTLAGAWLEIFTSFGLLNSFGALEDYFVRVYLSDTSLFAIGWIASVQEFLIFATGLVVGIPFDRGYFYHIVLFGAAFNTFSLFMLSLAQPQQFYQIMLSLGVASGIGAGCILLPATAAIGQSFPRGGPLATGFAYTGASVGGLVMPLILNNVLYTNLGYASTIKIVAGIIGTLSFAGIALMRPRNLRPKSSRIVPAPPATVAGMLAYAKEPEYVAVVIGLFCISISVIYPLFYMQLNATQHGVRESVAFKIPTIINASAIPGRLILNYISQRIGILNTMIFNAVACAAVILSMRSIEDAAPAPFIVISVIYGFFSGAILSQINTALASEAHTVHEIGTRTGVGFLFTGFAALLCSPVIGWLLTKEYHWWKANTFGAAFLVASAMFLALARTFKVKRIGSQFV